LTLIVVTLVGNSPGQPVRGSGFATWKIGPFGLDWRLRRRLEWSVRQPGIVSG